MLLALGCGLFWLGRSVVTPDQIDDRVSTIIKPLQARAEWIEAELRRHDQREAHPRIAEQLDALEKRIQRLEK